MKKYSAFETQLGESALDLTDKAKLSLYKKSQNSGISVDILEEVYRRGYRCWTEAFGGTPEQFAFDRVNSFIAEGFAAQLDEDLKKACWKGYEAVGMKKKNGKTVPNCVPVKEQLNAPLPPVETIADKFDKPVSTIKRVIKSGAKVEKEHTKDQKTAEKIATAHVNERPDYYKKLNKAGLEENAEKHSKNPDDPASRFMGSDELVDIYKKDTPGQTIKRVVKEATAYVPPPTYDVTAGKPTSSYSRSVTQSGKLNQSGTTFRNTSTANPASRSVRSGTGSARTSIGGQSGYSSASQQLKPTSMSTRVTGQGGSSFSASRSVPTPDSRLSSSGGGSMKPTSVSSKTPSFSQGGGLNKMGDKLTDMTRKMDKGFVPSNQMGQTLAKGFGKTAADVASKLGKIAGPVGVAAEVMKSTPAGEKQTEFQRQDQLKNYNPFKASGRSVSDYEKDVLTPKTYDKPAAANPKVDAPTPPSRPEYFSRGQAFQAAHQKAGDVGKFTYDNKEYQSNVEGKPYLPASKLKPTGIEAESGKIKKIKEAISENWQKSKYKNPEGGLTQAGVDAYRRENPGSKLQTAVTTKPSKLDPDSKPAKRRKSFCARMGGMKKRLTSAKTANDPDSRINKALRKWNCEETNYEGNE